MLHFDRRPVRARTDSRFVTSTRLPDRPPAGTQQKRSEGSGHHEGERDDTQLGWIVWHLAISGVGLLVAFHGASDPIGVLKDFSFLEKYGAAAMLAQTLMSGIGIVRCILAARRRRR